MRNKYPVGLSDGERTELTRRIAARTDSARKLIHARILLKADQSERGPAWMAERIAEAVEVSQPTVTRTRKQYVEDGLATALNRRPPRRIYQPRVSSVCSAVSSSNAGCRIGRPSKLRSLLGRPGATRARSR